ncbi:2688_t:CDS:2 [Ambispora leptoticha]|uniref:ER membrane protein complex subunit 10 n=1 Tax=Ambispora leptoticha TaxID=144679 RepID=A0A9N8VE91_9GLOM|nr:2688_t:CDS:2 [Ambispora leptoticha]
MTSLRVLFILLCISSLLYNVVSSESVIDTEKEEVEQEQLYEHKYTIYHKLSYPESTFKKRGQLTLIPSRSVAKYSPADNENDASLTLTDSLNSQNDNDTILYHIKLVDEQDPNKSFISFTKWCLLLTSDFEDEIIIHLDKDSNLFHFDYYTTQPLCTASSDAYKNVPSIPKFKTTAQTIKAVKGVRPKLAKAAPLRPDGTIETPPPEKSFLQKYWIYIVPLLIVLLFGGGPEEEGQRGQGGQGGQGGRPNAQQ